MSRPALPRTNPNIVRSVMPKTSLKNIQKLKKKARRKIPRAPVSRVQGNTAGVRRRLKKMAGKARAAKKA